MTSEYQKTCNLREVKKRGEVTKRNVIACPYCGQERDGEEIGWEEAPFEREQYHCECGKTFEFCCEVEHNFYFTSNRRDDWNEEELKMTEDVLNKIRVNGINNKIMELRAHRGPTGDISDGHHTFDELYYHRMFLTSIIANNLTDKAWKSEVHADGGIMPGMFVMGFTTPKGNYTYHYMMQYWDMFNIKELERAPEYDGHTASDIDRLLSLFGEG